MTLSLYIWIVYLFGCHFKAIYFGLTFNVTKEEYRLRKLWQDAYIVDYPLSDNEDNQIILVSNEFSSTQMKNINDDKGICICAGRHMISDAVALINQIREEFLSSTSITILHCNELELFSENLITGNGANKTVNVCDNPTFLDASIESSHSKLRSWYCKTAALLLSPYLETIVIDVDVILFKDPSKLFFFPPFQKSGLLFFRDRVLLNSKKKYKEDKIYQEFIEDIILREMNLINYNMSLIELAKIKIKESSASNNMFWKSVIDRESLSFNNFQDSSMILINKSTHSKFLQILKKLLNNWNTAYGDKEIYWLAAIMSNESFSFEPFNSGSYGSCGLIFHYDPNDYYLSDYDNIIPLYMNTQRYLDKILTLGHSIKYEMSKPIIADISNVSIYSCQCHENVCRTVPDIVNQYILKAQYERLSRKFSRVDALPTANLVTAIYHNSSNLIASMNLDVYNRISYHKYDCVPIFKNTSTEISKMIQNFFINKSLCPKIGCIHSPITIHSSYINSSQHFCCPISYSMNPSNNLTILETFAQIPIPPYEVPEGMLVKGVDDTVYIMKNHKLHSFPDAQTFWKMGYDFKSVNNLTPDIFNGLIIGDSIPSM